MRLRELGQWLRRIVDDRVAHGQHRRGRGRYEAATHSPAPTRHPTASIPINAANPRWNLGPSRFSVARERWRGQCSSQGIIAARPAVWPLESRSSWGVCSRPSRSSSHRFAPGRRRIRVSFPAGCGSTRWQGLRRSAPELRAIAPRPARPSSVSPSAVAEPRRCWSAVTDVRE